jgi:hypothetical protein
VLKFSRDGVLLKSITEDIRKEKLKCPHGVAVFQNGQLLVTDSTLSRVFVLAQ